MDTVRKLPAGLQYFEGIREEGYLYVDKTDLIWRLVNQGKKFNYLSRPRRFGKSILVDTLRCYLEGRKELFEGLKIMELEKDWTVYPIIRFDMSLGGETAVDLCSYLNKLFKKYEKLYQIVADPTDSLANRFDSIIVEACRQTGQRVAILIDEYDAPLQHSWMTPHHEECTAIYRSVFSVLKVDDLYEKFVFITGITKFTQISLFSVLNNLNNISFDPQFATLCGITEQEIADNFQPEMQRLADMNGWTLDEAHDRLKEYYDGYHFSRRSMTDVYNPFSLINALSNGELSNYWASSGATSMLPKFVPDLETRLEYYDNCLVLSDLLETSDVTGGGSEVFLYQSGYLTIKGCEDDAYLLGIPNTEVRRAMNRVVVPTLIMRSVNEAITAQNMLRTYLSTGNVPEAMKSLRALIADAPYSNRKFASMDMEERYRLIVSTVLNAIGYRVEVERMLSRGRIDIVAWATRYVYVMELKLQKNGGLAAAIQQIRDNGYAEPFKVGDRTPVCLALELDDLGKGLLDWQVVEA